MTHPAPPTARLRALLPFASALGLSALLAACVPPALPDLNLEGTGSAALSGVLVQGEGAPVVAGSRVRLYLAGDHRRSVGQTQTTTSGRFSFAALPAGRYDLAFSEAGYAASELRGAEASAPGMEYTVVQPLLRDPGGPQSVPELTVTDPGTGQPLDPDGTQAYTGRLELEVRTMPGSLYQRPLRRFEVTLLQPDGAGGLTALHPAGGTVVPSPTADPADSGPLHLSTGSVQGAALLQVAATDFNNNRVAVLYPVKLTPAAGTAVSAPQDVTATAYTWSAPAADGAIQAQALAPSSGRLVVSVRWNQDSASTVNGFEVWRAASAGGPWTRVALAAPENCTGGVCSVLDATPSLQAGQAYFYRVTAVGQNRADSVPGTQPDTLTLSAFRPVLLSPGAGQADLPLAPVYALSTPLAAVGATGATLGFTVADDLLGTGTPWSVGVQLRQVYGQAGQPAGQADNQVLLLRGGRYDPVYSDRTPAGNLSGVAYDAATGTLSLTHNFDGAGSALQPARRYRWTLGRAAAFRLQDPARPPGALNPVVAWSVYSDPTGTGAQDCPAQPLLPDGSCLDGGPSLEFTTAASP